MKYLLAVASLFLIVPSQAAVVFTVSPFDDTTYVEPGPNGDASGYSSSVLFNGDDGGVEFLPSGALTLGDLTNLAFDYKMALGAYGAGTPRIAFCDSSFCGDGSALIALDFLTSGLEGNTGNLITNGASDVFTTGTGFGCNIQAGATWSAFLTCAGSGAAVTDVFLVLDWSAGAQQTLITGNYTLGVNGVDQNFQATPEPSTLALGAGIGFILLGRRLLRRRSSGLLPK